MIAPPKSFERLERVLADLVDERVGIIRVVEEWPREPGGPAFFHYYAEACNTRRFTVQKNFGETGGASTNRKIALGKAIGEAVERYCSAIYDPDEFPIVPYRSATFPCIHPDRFVCYSPEQYRTPGFPYVPFIETTPVCWAPLQDPLTQETKYVPAALLYVPYLFQEERGEACIGQRISTGLACHCSYEEAAIAAICEVIERDAITITWQAQVAWPHIHLETLSGPNRDLVSRFERIGSTVTLLYLAMDHGLPTILAVAQGHRADSPALCFAASTELNPEHAVRKSLEELAHTRRLAQELTIHRPRFSPGPEFENVNGQDAHVHLYCHPEFSHLGEFIFGSSQRISFADLPRFSIDDPITDLQTLLHHVCKVNHQVLLADLTTPDVRELGLWVMKAVIPGFHPLFLGHHIRALGGSRLWELPQKLGFSGISKDRGDNPAPHPFP
jgi:ribosomal protein S12 methylthiotransferase accessory factor